MQHDHGKEGLRKDGRQAYFRKDSEQNEGQYKQGSSMTRNIKNHDKRVIERGRETKSQKQDQEYKDNIPRS